MPLENSEQQLPETPAITLVPANFAKRLANYLIDFIIFSFVLSVLLRLVAPYYPLANQLLQEKPDMVKLMDEIRFIDQLMLTFVYGLYMSFIEAMLRGKTIGKFITGTRAVTANGLPINAQTAFIRGLIRIIPFEIFSAISMPPRPWHDRWSKTFVVDESKSILPKI